MKKVPSAGVRLGKGDALPNKPFDGAGKKASPFNGNIGGPANRLGTPKNYGKKGK